MCRYIVLSHMVTQYAVLPYMVLCSIYKQNIVDLESFMLKNVVIYRQINAEKYYRKNKKCIQLCNV